MMTKNTRKLLWTIVRKTAALVVACSMILYGAPVVFAKVDLVELPDAVMASLDVVAPGLALATRRR